MTDTAPGLVHQELTLSYDYAPGEVATRFLEGLKERKLLASQCSASKLTYLPPRAFCERSFEPCDTWVEAGLEGVIECSTVVVRGFEGKRPAPVAIAYVRLDGVDSAVANYIDDLDLSDFDTAIERIAPGVRVRVEFVDEPEGRITDFAFRLVDDAGAPA